MKGKTLPMLVGKWLEFLSGGDEKEMDVPCTTEMDIRQETMRFFNELSKVAGKKVTRVRPGMPRKKAGTGMNNSIISPY